MSEHERRENFCGSVAKSPPFFCEPFDDEFGVASFDDAFGVAGRDLEFSGFTLDDKLLDICFGVGGGLESPSWSGCLPTKQKIMTYSK